MAIRTPVVISSKGRTGDPWRLDYNVSVAGGQPALARLGTTFRAQLRRSANASLAATLAIEFDLTTGAIAFVLTPAQTAQLSAGNYVFDCQGYAEDGAPLDTWLVVTITFSEDITHD